MNYPNPVGASEVSSPTVAAGVSPHLEQTSTGYRLSYAADGGLTVADLSDNFTLTTRGKCGPRC